MTKGEAINWIINISADIGKVEHRGLWHYEQALSEIREMLESEELHYDEWCDSCKEYDQNRKSCPRWNHVIRQTIDELKEKDSEHSCSTCRYDNLEWYEEPCDNCTMGGATNHWKPITSTTAKRVSVWSSDGMVCWYECDMCHEPVDEKDKFCPECGRRLVNE